MFNYDEDGFLIIDETYYKNKSLDDYIEHYGDYVDNYLISPYEHIDAFMIRDKLLRYEKKLSQYQKEKLKQYDEILFNNAAKMREYIGNTFNFEENTIDPTENFWWHLDKVANGTIKRDF